MAYIPPNAQWYVAELVEEICVEGDARNVVHRNLVLVKASSPEDAYRRAMDLGQQRELTYRNPEGRTVVSRFRGLRELDVVHDPLEHGAELRFCEDISVPEERVATWLKTKEQLNVFCDVEPSKGRPNYSCKEIVDEVVRLIHQDSQNQD